MTRKQVKEQVRSWPIIGHDGLVSVARRTIADGQIHNAYLLYGSRGTGRKLFARLFMAEVLKLEDHSLVELHRNVCTLPAGGSDTISIDDVREAVSLLKLSIEPGAHKFLFIKKAELMSEQAWNALLKVIEEPPQQGHIIMVAETLNSAPVTIRSRSHLLKLNSVRPSAMNQWLKEIAPAELVEPVGLLASGRPGQAKRLTDDTLADYKSRCERIFIYLNRQAGASFKSLHDYHKSQKIKNSDSFQRDFALETSLDADYMETAFRDMIFIVLGRTDIIHSQFYERLKVLARLWSVSELLEATQRISSFRHELKDSPNVMLQWENFLISLNASYEKN